MASLRTGRVGGGALLACVLLAAAAMAPASAADLADHIEWKTWKEMEGFDYASNTKPILYFFHKSWCGACKRLVGSLNDPAEAKGVIDYSKEFIMVQVLDDDAGSSPPAQFVQDGTYIPRIFFASPKGEVNPAIKNDQGNPKFKYFYSSSFEVERGMRHGLMKLKRQPKDEL